MSFAWFLLLLITYKIVDSCGSIKKENVWFFPFDLWVDPAKGNNFCKVLIGINCQPNFTCKDFIS